MQTYPMPRGIFLFQYYIFVYLKALIQSYHTSFLTTKKTEHKLPKKVKNIYFPPLFLISLTIKSPWWFVFQSLIVLSDLWRREINFIKTFHSLTRVWMKDHSSVIPFTLEVNSLKGDLPYILHYFSQSMHIFD